jgi:hypothetical protein
MTSLSAADTPVRWKSLAGVGLVLMLVYGLLNFAAAIGVPLTLEMKGTPGGGGGGVIMTRGAEEYMVGTTYERLHNENPKLDKLLVDSMLGMCSMMMSMAIAVLGITWNAARRGARWAPWVVMLSAIAWVPYYFIIASDMTKLGATGAMTGAWNVALFAVPAVLGAILMLASGPRGPSPSTQRIA